jgi:lambda family phage minor tail protein L
MTTNANLARDQNQLQQTSPFVELFILDSTNIPGGQIYRITNYASSLGPPVFGGVSYQPFPITTSGWDFSTTGAMCRPTVTISNVDKTFLSAVINLGDLVSASFTRIRTKEKFLDTGATPDPFAYYGPDKYIINDLTYQDNTIITFTLANILDRMGMRFPGRQILKDPSVNNLYAPGVSRTRIR